MTQTFAVMSLSPLLPPPRRDGHPLDATLPMAKSLHRTGCRSYQQKIVYLSQFRHTHYLVGTQVSSEKGRRALWTINAPELLRKG